MSGSPAPTSVYFDLLQRVCDIAKVATWTTGGGAAEQIKQATPRRFTPVVGPYPLVMAFTSGVRYEYAMKYVDHFVTVTVQVWAGPVGAGYAGDMEDRLNHLYMALPHEFESRPLLNDPTTNVELDYLYPDDFAHLTESPTGTDGFEVDEGNGVVTRYFGTEFLLAVHLRLPRSRKS